MVPLKQISSRNLHFDPGAFFWCSKKKNDQWPFDQLDGDVSM